MSSEKTASKSTQTFIIDSKDYEFEHTIQNKKSPKVDINLLMDKLEKKRRRKRKKT